MFAAARTRTWDHLVNSEALYQLSYGGSIMGFGDYRVKSFSFGARPLRSGGRLPHKRKVSRFPFKSNE